jgi:hypothetical protein
MALNTNTSKEIAEVTVTKKISINRLIRNEVQGDHYNDDRIDDIVC